MNVDELALKAGDLYRDGQLDQCLSLLNQALKHSPSHGLSLEYKGLVLQKKGDFEKALECWDVLIANKGDIAMYYGERGVCKFNLRFKSALKDFDKAVELEPKSAYRYSARAYVKDKIGDLEGAIADYHRCLELDPEDAIALNNLAVTEQKRGNQIKAESLFNKADELLGVESIADRRKEWKKLDTEPSRTHKGMNPSERRRLIFKEIRKMLTSRKGFRDFLREL